MNRDLLAAVVSGALALPMAAQVQAQADDADVQPHSHPATYEHDHEMDDGSMSPLHAHQHDAHPHAELHGHSATVYGTVRSGVIIDDSGASGADAMWDIGSVDAGDVAGGDRLFSRIGVRASTEIGGGMMAGAVIEKRVDNWRTRHQNVWLSGSFGTVTLGQQGSPYQSATSWDGANFMGGNFDLAGLANGGDGSRTSGVSYASSLGGPFNFSAMVRDDEMSSDAQGGGVDGFEIAGTLAAGPVSIGAGYSDSDAGVAVMGATVGGSFGAIGWEIGFETSDPDMGEDTTHAGFFVDYSIGDGAVYFYLEDSSGATDDSAWVAGYSHSLGSGVSVIGEHRDIDSSGATRSILAVVVGF